MSAVLNIKWQNMAFPLVGLLAFLFFWQIAASQGYHHIGLFTGPGGDRSAIHGAGR